MKGAVVLRGARDGETLTGKILGEGAGFRAKLVAFKAETQGSITMTFGLTMLVLCAMVGLAVDYARFINARSQTIEATDAAVLAGARALQSNGGDQTAAQTVAQTYYTQATKNRIQVVPGSDTINFIVTDNGTAMQTQGNVKVATPFMHLAFLGTDKGKTLPLLRADGSDYSKAVLAVGGNGETNLEVSMMLDITGSMSGQKLTDMKSAASDLVNIVVWSDQSEYTSKIAIVPFAYDVRLPTSAFKLATGTTKTTSPCVVERTGTQKYTDAAPKSGQYVMVHSSASNKVTPTCDLSSSEELLPLTSDKTALLAKISGLQTEGSTAGHVGTAWAWYMLSPSWSSLWSSSSTPAAYGTDKLKKIAILMTDGEYNTSYTSYGYPVSELISGTKVTCKGSANTDCSAAQAVAQCTAMKAKGIEVYTVGFQLGGSQLAINTLSSCATDADHFYNSSTGDALKAAFRDIALKISSLYLSQ
ncbi:MAG: pilus assembly protein [Hyphomicrobium sp.]|uniref:TadE/TadG family type IV pilus assembly protein n=1 Tax=Hyphomicrobium sp. TaxID=82 RepID=UPI0039E28AF9